ncbi:MAG: hypothetical protein ABI560_12540, partial [Myxococcales bacterium]
MSLLAFAAAGGCARHPPVTAPGLALRKVVIYRNGVGYFERGGHVDEDRVQFRVRRDEVGDFLASLTVLERGGSSVRSASFPLEVQKEDGSTPPHPTPRPMPMSMSMSTEPGDSVPGGSRPAWSPGTADNPNGFPNGFPNGLQTVIMSLDGREHDLQVGYIAATPVWKPSYRLVIEKDGGANLQAWGIVQNLSGEDWNNISLSLIAEAPLAFDASLATPVIPARPMVTDGGDVIAVVPRSETSLAEAPPQPAAAASPLPPAMPQQEMSAPAEADSADNEAQVEAQMRDQLENKKGS